ncbi:MAG: dihydrolipoamide acetyltransferase family protein, partial [Streptosporangiaceae bacterium]
ASPPPRPGEAAAAPTAGGQADDEEVPLTAVRRITARRLTESAAAPHFYLTGIIDAGPLLAFRTEVNNRLAAGGTKVSLTDLLVRACAVTLRAHPQVNSSWGGDKIILHRRIHMGVAVALDDGLIVPVIRDTDRKSLGEIAAEARMLADRARAGKLVPQEFTGSTFTISNLGMFGVDHFTAVINPPEAAILAVGAVTEEPVVRDGQLTGRPTIKLTLSIDHRVLDGATAAVFLRDLKDTLQEPLRIVI